MSDFRDDMQRVQVLVGDAFRVSGRLIALADGGQMNAERLQKTLERTCGQFENSTLELRRICETYATGAGGYGRRGRLPREDIIGYAEKIGDNWLHLCVHTLLPHCRYQPPAWLTDSIQRLLDAYEAKGNQLPFYRKAMLVIDEHSDIAGRHIFDQDNKGWKAVSNAFKGRLIPDDDQYTLALSMLSTRSNENACHITLMDLADASDFFALHSGDYALNNVYQWP